MATNFLDYSGLSYDDVVTAINTKITSDPRFSNYNDSQISALINQILAATTDFTLFMMDNCFNENFFQTAQLRSSVINLSRNLGYTIQRPISSTATMSVRLHGKMDNKVVVGDSIQIPYHSKFTYTDLNFILKESMYIPITTAMYNRMVIQGENYDEIVQVDYKNQNITLVEGVMKEKIITGQNNPFTGSIFQLYKIEDTTFSNHYADTDFDNPTTTVFCGTNKNRQYTIDKRSVINWKNFTQESFSQVNQICVMRTGSDEGIELLFGDGVFADIGSKNSTEDIWITYLSSQGSKGNRTGLINEKLSYSGTIYSSSDADLSDNVEFLFRSNAIGGADMESIDSIKMNAPSIFYSLDRLVTQQDYVNYLKSLKSPIIVKNALAWGEQQEVDQQSIDCDLKMFNVVLFTVLGSLYNLDVSPFSPRETHSNLDAAVLDSYYDEYAVQIRGYFNMYIRQNQISQFNEYTAEQAYWQYPRNLSASSTPTTSNINSAKATLSAYGASAPLAVQYFSPTYDKALIGTSAVTVDVSNIDAYSTIEDAMGYVADQINSVLVTIVDGRGLESTNGNRGNLALPTVSASYDSVYSAIKITADGDDPCLIYTLSGNFAADIGLSGTTGIGVIQTETDLISQNILTVRELIQERTEITVQSVYLTPIIHSYVLSGDVYVSPVFDKIAVKTEIEDALYSFFDTNNDFNKPVYISEVIDIIKSNKGVKFCDVSFAPLTPVNNTGYEYFFNAELAKPIYSTYWSVQYPSLFDDLEYESYIIIDNATLGGANYTERALLNDLKKVYNNIAPTAEAYADSNDFLNWCTAIRKDVIGYIKSNLINPYGNIGEMVVVNDVKTHQFTVGTEIAKITCQMNYNYKG